MPYQKRWLEGVDKISMEEVKDLWNLLKNKNYVATEKQRKKAKDVWVTQKCAEILQNASKTYDYTSKMAAGLADLPGKCEGRSDFSQMMKVVIGLPTLIQQEAQAKII